MNMSPVRIQVASELRTEVFIPVPLDFKEWAKWGNKLESEKG